MIEGAFEDRMITAELTREFLEQGLGVDSSGEAIELVSDEILRFERNYNAIAQATESRERAAGFSIKITAIPAIDADMGEVSRGLNEIERRLFRQKNEPGGPW